MEELRINDLCFTLWIFFLKKKSSHPFTTPKNSPHSTGLRCGCWLVLFFDGLQLWSLHGNSTFAEGVSWGMLQPCLFDTWECLSFAIFRWKTNINEERNLNKHPQQVVERSGVWVDGAKCGWELLDLKFSPTPKNKKTNDDISTICPLGNPFVISSGKAVSSPLQWT